MAGNYPQGEDVGSYSHPQFTEYRTQSFNINGAPSASAKPFAVLQSRNKILVDRVFVRSISSPSTTAGTLCVHFVDTGATATTLKALTVSACSAGWQTSITFTAKTLETITQFMALYLTNNEKGDWLVTYEYQVLYPGTY